MPIGNLIFWGSTHMILYNRKMFMYGIHIQHHSATTTPYFSADIFLRYYGTLTERQPVYVSTGGFVYPPDGQKLIGTKNPSFNYSVLVGYTGASLYNETISNPAVPFIGGQTYAPLVENSTPQISSIPVDLPQSLFPWNQIITWDVQGDYYPYIMIKFSNGTEITQTYPDYKIHINGYDVVTAGEVPQESAHGLLSFCFS